MIQMNTLSLFITALAMGASQAQPTFQCYGQPDSFLSEKQASRERWSIMTKLDSFMSKLEKMEAELAEIQQDMRCSSPEQIFRQKGNSLYMLSLSRLNWAQARERCHQCGYSLVRIESDDEQQYIRKWLMDIDAEELAYHQGSRASIWMDGTDHGHEGCLVWTYPDVTLISSVYTDWHPGNPNNYGGNEHCNRLYIADELKWNDNDCNSDGIFLCKKVTSEATTALPSLDEISDTSLC